MPIKSISKKVVLIPGVIVIAAAVALFLNAAGPADARVTAAFTLLVILSLVLLAVILSTRTVAEAPVPVEANISDKGAAISEPDQAAAPAEPAGSPAPAPETPPRILSETAVELRTSVEVMQEELEEILDEEVPADKEHMESLYQETDRLRKIIDGMEQMAKAQDLAKELKTEPVQVESLMKDIVETMRQTYPEKEITYAVECETGLIMNGDAECIGRILGNITDNAVKSVRGAGSVMLGASRKGDETVLFVRDTGTGIRRAHLGHIYERFFRGTGSGVGMGLSVVKELVDACKGRIDVETRVGQGTTFTVTMPG